MNERWSLRSRIAAAYVVLACAVCGSFAAVAVFIMASLEDRLIDRRLARTADQVVQRHAEGRDWEPPPSVRVYWNEAIPEPLRALSPGKYDMPMNGLSVNVLVRREGEQTVVLTDDDADFERIEWEIYALMAGAFAACVALALALGRATASQVIAPVTALARAVEQDELTALLPQLDLRDEMGVLARAFSSRTEDLQAVLLRERWFVGDVSHELRTPLTVMLGAAEVLCARTPAPSDLHDHAERIRRTAADAADRVAALLMLSRSPEQVDAPLISLATVARTEIDRCRPLLEGKDVRLELLAPVDVQIHARPELAGMAIGNLVRNACQFTEQGQVTVRLDAWRLTVEDTGIGIPEALRERVFERFVRGNPDTSAGSGLGLAIVRRVAEHLGWRVALESPTGGGSRFTLDFGAAAFTRS